MGSTYVLSEILFSYKIVQRASARNTRTFCTYFNSDTVYPHFTTTMKFVGLKIRSIRFSYLPRKDATKLIIPL